MEGVVDSRRVASNTLALYARLVVTLAAQLWLARVTLQALGVDGYGLWSAVGAIVALVAFLGRPMESSVQRFLTFDLGKGGVNQRRVFSAAYTLYFIITIAVVLLLETGGLWWLNNVMRLGNQPVAVANWTLQMAIGATAVSLMRLPFDSVILARERMGFYAKAALVEAALMVLIGVGLIATPEPSVALYATMILVLRLIMGSLSAFYCRKKFPEDTRFLSPIDTSLMKEMARFCGLTIMTALAIAATTQGLNILINAYFGLELNAAYGLAMQVGSVTLALAMNLQKASSPQIVKSWAAGDREGFAKLVTGSACWAFALVLAVALPLIINAQYVLTLWLGKVPAWTGELMALMLIQGLIFCSVVSTDAAIGATGKQRSYQLWMSGLTLGGLASAWVVMALGYSVVMALVAKVLVEVLIWVARVAFLHRQVGIKVANYLRETLVPIFSLWIIAFLLVTLSGYWLDEKPLPRLVVTTAVCWGVIAWFMRTYSRSRLRSARRLPVDVS